ncbi:putative glycine dehydrogenase [decarboxylating] subunit 1 [Tritrichomonas foetus]|uniref:Glycine dehydrogenase [decarboxylating] subunit 1 n=1 Tax=Tritrichomonas foetus TaxID=1144522 RepID=A0A1J4KJ64_9EUKA|nr:putative glycine dehydrogenase [decarboxylating] subunit 1 [Tritrichomonas foetus]|eukprot:OHT09718.1 putative glycine dehydrogenase [decarboxylating] subunit 1 [Tritrichomonas foetus]
MMLSSFKRCLNHRFLPHSDETRKAMLDVIGVKTQEDLFSTIPNNLKCDMSKTIPSGVDEKQVLQKFQNLASKNLPASETAFFLGAGSYRHYVPALVDHLIQRSEFMTPYTPYQSEISQGTLQALFEFQTLVANISSMDFSNATMYDGATSCMESALVATRVTHKPKILIHPSLHPHWIQVVETAGRHNPNITVERMKTQNVENWKDVACVIVQNPSVDGSVCDLSNMSNEAHKNKALLVAACSEIVSLGLIKPPGQMGADIFAAEGSSLGSTMNFGGPLLGLFAANKSLMRQAPGRLIGQTKDSDGNDVYCLTLAAREQHIKRDKATSNICTSSSLMGIAFSIHLALLGKEGFAKMAQLNHINASKLTKLIGGIEGVKIDTDKFFNEFTVTLPKAAEPMVDSLVEDKVMCGVPYTRLYRGFDSVNENKLLMAATELTTEDDMLKVYSAMKKYLVK